MKKRRAKKHITRDEVPLGVRVLLFVALVAAIFATLWMSKKELVLANTSPTMVNVTGIEEVGGNGQICLKTEAGKPALWKASYTQLAEYCNRGFPFALDVWLDADGYFYFFNPNRARLFVIACALLGILFAPMILVWKFRERGITSRGRELNFQMPSHLERAFTAWTLGLQGGLILLFMGIYYYHFGWTRWLLLLPIALLPFVLFALRLKKVFYALMSLVLLNVGTLLLPHLFSGVRLLHASPTPIFPERCTILQTTTLRRKHHTTTRHDLLVSYKWNNRLYYAHLSQPSRESDPCQMAHSTPLAVVDDNDAPRVLSSEYEPLIRVLLGGIGGVGCLVMGAFLAYGVVKSPDADRGNRTTY